MNALPADQAISTEPTPIRRRRAWTRLSAGHVLMILAFLLAAVANLVVLRRADVTYPVAVAATDLVPGRTVRPEDLRIVEIDAGPEVLATLVNDPTLGVGQVVTRLIPAGDLVRTSDLEATATFDRQRAMSIPVARSHAAGGAISVGDRVDVIAVVEDKAHFVAAGAEVIEVSSPGEGALSGGAEFFVVISVDSQTALDLAGALNTGDIEVVRSTGAPPVPVEEAEVP